MQNVVQKLERAVTSSEDVKCVVEAVRTSLIARLTIRGWLPEDAMVVSHEGYARHLLHRDPAGRFSVVAMVWAPGQKTPIHDHAGVWCVEGVYSGCIRVTSYDMKGDDGELFRFERCRQIDQGVGCAGSLIPPVEYHVIENAEDEPAITVHVYGGELESCSVFLPESDGVYRMVNRPLSYTSTCEDVAAK